MARSPNVRYLDRTVALWRFPAGQCIQRVAFVQHAIENVSPSAVSEADPGCLAGDGDRLRA
jgi:hypothetical protein